MVTNPRPLQISRAEVAVHELRHKQRENAQQFLREGFQANRVRQDHHLVFKFFQKANLSKSWEQR